MFEAQQLVFYTCVSPLHMGAGQRIPPFAAAMTGFQTMNSRDYMRATDETLAMLKWLRQFADAVSDSNGAQTR